MDDLHAHLTTRQSQSSFPSPPNKSCINSNELTRACCDDPNNPLMSPTIEDTAATAGIKTTVVMASEKETF